MSREEIKKIVYEKLTELFYDEHEFEVKMSQYPNNGEDRFIYNEVELDELDVITFIDELENAFNNIHIEDGLFRYDCTIRNIIDYIYNEFRLHDYIEQEFDKSIDRGCKARYYINEMAKFYNYNIPNDVEKFIRKGYYEFCYDAIINNKDVVSYCKDIINSENE